MTDEEEKQPLTRAGWLNVLLIQWLFVRLVTHTNDDGSPAGFGLMGFVVPCTGWWSDYINIGRQWFTKPFIACPSKDRPSN